MEWKCSSCGETKPVEEFYARRNRVSGVSSICKVCRREKYGKPRLKRNAELGLCYCGREREAGKARCSSCNQHQRRSDAASRERVRAGGLCYNCRKVKAADGYTDCDECAAKKAARNGHGAGLVERQRLFESQSGICPICEAPLNGWLRKKNAVVDHDHETGKVRGLLHDGCNLLVGKLDLALAQRIVGYLSRPC